MQKDTIQNVFIGILVGGIVLLSGGMFFLYQQMRSVSESVKQIEQTPTTKAETPTPATPVQQRTLTLEEANRRLLEFTALEESGDWNSQYLLANLQAEPLQIGNGTVHLPYDPEWGNAQYQLDTFDEANGEYFFGPMYFSEFGGASRPGSVRETSSRTLEAALADPSYTSEGCSGTKTFKPVLLNVGNIQAVRYEGEACEATWVGYEISVQDRNLIISVSPAAEEDLALWVLERM
ncbi:hypothetical protein M0Q28_01800 [Patescibacteria group bacterium]|jgi:hypothetical protein|nr:hypothetical protein [Patescibacteria group bacterium]